MDKKFAKFPNPCYINYMAIITLEVQNTGSYSLEELKSLLLGYINKLTANVPKHRRNLGILEGKASVSFSDDFSMTAEELVSL